MTKQILNKVLETSTRAKVAVAVCAPAVVSAAFPLVAHASDSVGLSDVTGVIDMVKSVISLLGTPPLSYFLGGGLALMAFKIFRGGKQAAN